MVFGRLALGKGMEDGLRGQTEKRGEVDIGRMKGSAR